MAEPSCALYTEARGERKGLGLAEALMCWEDI